MSEKHFINLLQPELLPKKPPLTLQRVVIAWGVSLVAMLFVIGYCQQLIDKQNQIKSALTADKQQKQNELTALEVQFVKQKKDPKLVRQLGELQWAVDQKQHLHQQLTDASTAYVAGFASAMTELAQFHRNGVSVERIKITPENILLAGVARTPEIVPLWLSGFKQSQLLSGQSFSHFKLQENKQRLTEFVVSSNLVEETL